jgi:predicted glutamine amidotransferase
MCRFLLYKSIEPSVITNTLNAFARMAKISKAYDGDSQCDGWGISWLENNKWHTYKSVRPIWEDVGAFTQFPQSKIFAIHARSASFPQHKNNIEFNQPYVNEQYSFVFNGLLKGVTLAIPGNIGAQKIWNLLNGQLKTKDVGVGFQKTVDILKKNARVVQALNMGIAHKDAIAAYSAYAQHPVYYSLHYVDEPTHKLICSEPIDGFSFKTIPNNSFLLL